MKTSHVIILHVLIVGILQCCNGLDVYVSILGSDSSGNGTSENPFATISKAIASGGDSVLVGQGEYWITSTISITSSSAVTQIRALDPAAKTTILSNVTNLLFSVVSKAVNITGLRIDGQGRNQTGIRLQTGRLTLQNVCISNLGFGGIMATGSSTSLSESWIPQLMVSGLRCVNCTFSGNSKTLGPGPAIPPSPSIPLTANGAAVLQTTGNSTFINCKFLDNYCTRSGGAMSLNSHSATFQNCTFLRNTAVATTIYFSWGNGGGKPIGLPSNH